MKFPRPLAHLTCLALTAAGLLAQGAAPQTVLDYYDLLTPEELPALDSPKPRRALIKLQDLANGFLSVENNEGEAQVALFRKKDRTAIIGVTQMECGPVCGGFVKLLQYRGGKWQDVTDALLPKAGSKEILAAYNRLKKAGDDAYTLEQPPSIYWRLPRTGTTVKMLTGDTGPEGDKVLMRFAWDGTRFTRTTK